MEVKPQVHCAGEGGAEDVDNSVYLNHCLFCNTLCTKAGYTDEWLSSSSPSIPSPNSSHLPGALFLVRILLEIPQDNGPVDNLSLSSVSSWLRTCEQCTKAVSQAQLIYSEILGATRRFRSVQQEIVEKLKGLSGDSGDKQRIHHDEDHMAIDNCRKFAQAHNYAEFGYPLTVHDKKSAGGAADQMEFTDVFLVKPEPDEQEMQFILPDDGNRTEHVEIQVNDLSAVPSPPPPLSSSSEHIGIQGEREYKCFPCNRSFNNRQTLYSHNQKYHKPDPRRTCEFCSQVLANLITYRRHKKENCSQNKNTGGLKKEDRKKVISNKRKCAISIHQLNKGNDQKISNSRKRYQIGAATKTEHRCVPCNRIFNNRQTLYAHNMKYHEPDPKKTCEFCGRVLANTVTYRRHKKENCKNRKGG